MRPKLSLIAAGALLLIVACQKQEKDDVTLHEIMTGTVDPVADVPAGLRIPAIVIARSGHHDRVRLGANRRYTLCGGRLATFAPSPPRYTPSLDEANWAIRHFGGDHRGAVVC